MSIKLHLIVNIWRVVTEEHSNLEMCFETSMAEYCILLAIPSRKWELKFVDPYNN